MSSGDKLVFAAAVSCPLASIEYATNTFRGGTCPRRGTESLVVSAAYSVRRMQPTYLKEEALLEELSRCRSVGGLPKTRLDECPQLDVLHMLQRCRRDACLNLHRVPRGSYATWAGRHSC